MRVFSYGAPPATGPVTTVQTYGPILLYHLAAHPNRSPDYYTALTMMITAQVG